MTQTGRAVIAAITLIGALVAVPAVPAHASGPEVTLLGAGGSFGGLQSSTSTPTGQSFSAHAVPGWEFEAGQAACFTTASKDRSVLVSNQPQTDNPISPTGRTMTVSACYPAADS